MSTVERDLDQTRLKSGCKTFCFKCNQQVFFDVIIAKNKGEVLFPSPRKRYPSSKNPTLISILPPPSEKCKNKNTNSY
jgi:hypothetical protein